VKFLEIFGKGYDLRFLEKSLAHCLMKLSTKIRPLPPLQTSDLTAIFKYLHLHASVWVQTLVMLLFARFASLNMDIVV
jgi:hypothetical protein